MIIKSIKLTNFRNYKTHSVDFQPDTTLILGKNGSGKTSILEAIYILLRGKSFRAKDAEIIKRGSDFYHIELEYFNGKTYHVSFNGQNKTFQIDDKKPKRLPKKNKYPVILFLPSDLNLISHSPSKRRDYFNQFFSELDENYHQYLLKYEKALKQRNELLKNKDLKLKDLFSWDILLTKYGTLVYKLRQKYLEEINSHLTKTYQSIAKNQDKVTISYQTEVKSSQESTYLKNLEQNTKKDIYVGYTSYGIHRDDFVFYFNDKPADGSASRGESRSIILALKFIEAKLITAKKRQKPVVLLDDVFSELDDTRQKCLVDNFKDHQVIITSVK